MENQSFKNWYLQTGGCSIVVDFNGRMLYVLDSEKQVVSELVLSTSIDSNFNLADLFLESHEIGDYVYKVLLDGYHGRHYLWRRKIVMTLQSIF